MRTDYSNRELSEVAARDHPRRGANRLIQIAPNHSFPKLDTAINRMLYERPFKTIFCRSTGAATLPRREAEQHWPVADVEASPVKRSSEKARAMGKDCDVRGLAGEGRQIASRGASLITRHLSVIDGGRS